MSPEEPGGEELEPGLNPAVLRRRREIVATFGSLALLLGAMAAVAYFFLRPQPLDLHEIVTVAEASVESAVGQDVQCRFPRFQEVRVEFDPEGHYTVSAWVEVVQRDGHSESDNFKCTVMRLSNGRWVPAGLKLYKP